MRGLNRIVGFFPPPPKTSCTSKSVMKSIVPMTRNVPAICTYSTTFAVRYAGRPAADASSIERERDVAAVERRDGEHVHQREVHVDDHAEPQHEQPAVLALKEHVVDAHHHHRPAELLDADAALRGRRELFHRLENLAGRLAELLAGMRIDRPGAPALIK